MKYTVAYFSQSYTQCGDFSCCSDAKCRIEFYNEDGTYSHEWESVPLLENGDEVMEYVQEVMEYARELARVGGDEEFVFDAKSSRFDWGVW